MAKKFKDLIAKMPPERQARIKARAQVLLTEMALDELREARSLTQEALAKKLRVRQAAVSKLERRTDMYLSSLRHFIEALGGKLEIRAVFPEAIIRISRLVSLGKQAKRTRAAKQRQVA